MGTKSKIIMTALISVAATAVVSVNATNFVNRNFGAFLPSANEEQNLINKINTIESYLNSAYLYDYDKTAATEAAIEGYVEALDEPYTHYYTKQEFTDYIDAVSDEYTGIGVVVSVNADDEIEVVSTFDGSPAHEAGILPKDVLLAVDGEEFGGAEMNEAVAKIKSGKSGEKVELTIKRSGEEKKITVARGDIEMDSVEGEMLEDGIGLVRISGFNAAAKDGGRDTYTEFKETVETLQGEGMKKMIIDLRDNPGGELNVVCNIADMLLPEGKITYMEYKDAKQDTYYSDEEALGIPMAVLINSNSASASEVLTGALKDYGVATIIGTKSYGKGIVQSVFPFNDGSGISMTVARYFSPTGVCIHDIGIEPDIKVEAPEKYKEYYASSIPMEEDTQLLKAIEELKGQK